MVTRRSAQRLEEKKCHVYLQEGQEGGLRELQAGQLHLRPWEGDRTNDPGNNFYTYEGQERRLSGVEIMDLQRRNNA